MSNRRLLITALSLILCLTVSVGLAAAYFTDYESARGGAILHLEGRTEIEEKMDGNNKIISVKNVGETDVVVRVMIIGDESHMTVTPGSGWTLGSDGYYYYGKVLKCGENGDGESTPEIKAEVTVKDDEDIRDFDIVVVQEAERVVYDGDAVVVPDGWAIGSIAAE